MTTERSDKVFDAWRQAVEKFDYFVLGITGALCAYISQTYRPVQLGMNSGTLELVALALLIFSAISGFKRIENTIEVTLLNHRLLRANEEKGILVTKSQAGTLVNESTGEIFSSQKVAHIIESITSSIPKVQIQIECASNAAMRWYHIRNRLILIGFVVLVASKVWSAYT